MKKILTFLIVGLFGLVGFSSCGKNSSTDSKGSADNPVKIGVVGAADKQWSVFKEKAQEQGIYVDIVDFQDYTSENPALSQSQLDMNEFQHILYLANYNIQNNDDIQPIGATAIFPMGLYSNDVKDYNKIPSGSKIAIPNDDTNQARAIALLANIKLVTLKDPDNELPSPADIDESKSKVTVVPIKAEQTPDAMKDPKIEGAVINNDFIGDAGVNFDDAIYAEDPKVKSAEPYINIFAVRNADTGNETYLNLVKIYHDPEVIAAAQEKSGDTAIICDNSVSELKEILSNLEEKIKANG